VHIGAVATIFAKAARQFIGVENVRDKPSKRVAQHVERDPARRHWRMIFRNHLSLRTGASAVIGLCTELIGTTDFERSSRCKTY
jgi:hypothetical protein